MVIQNDTLDSLDCFVPKPWGREYLCWRSPSCAIWLLELHSGASTSFHCHTKKNTGLIVLEGRIKLALINSEYYLGPLEKINIFRGRFHSSTCLSAEGATMLEVEAPVDKRDLIRWEDKYGREDSSYEKKVCSFEENDKRLLLHSTENKFIDEQFFRGVSFKIFSSNFQDRLSKGPGSFICLEGGIGLSEDRLVIVPGDACSSVVMEKLVSKFHVMPNSIFLEIKKKDS